MNTNPPPESIVQPVGKVLLRAAVVAAILLVLAAFGLLRWNPAIVH